MFPYYVVRTPMRTGIMDLTPIAGFQDYDLADQFASKYIIDNPKSPDHINVMYAFEYEQRVNANGAYPKH